MHESAMPATPSVPARRPEGLPYAAHAARAVRPGPPAGPARPARSARPVAAPASVRALLARAIVAWLDPIEPAPPRTGAPRAAPGYAAFDAPTYRRRGLRIAGLEPDDAPAAGSIVTRDESNACSTDSPRCATT